MQSKKFLEDFFPLFPRQRSNRYLSLGHDSQVLARVWRTKSRVWRKSKLLEHSIGRCQHAGAWALERRLWSPSILLQYRNGRIIWTEPVKS